jgi:kumamolisin
MLMAETALWAAPQAMLTRHTPNVVANGVAQPLGRMPASQILHFDAVLALRHQPGLENFLQEMYDPSSANYRHFVTVKQFTERFGPSQEDYDALLTFAHASGFQVVSGSRDEMDVRFTAPVSAVERAFHVTMNRYQHPTEKREFYAPDREPTVDLPFQLWHVSGLDNYSKPHPAFVRKDKAEKSDATTGSCFEQSYCGSDMRAAYYGGTSLTGAGQNLGLLEFYGYDLSDLNTYYQRAGQTLNVPVIGVSTDGSSLQCDFIPDYCDDTEQIIDMTQALGMAPNLAGLYVFVGQTDTALLSSMSSATPLPAQLSSSWTWGDSEYGPSDPQIDDPFFQKMAAQGQSFFEASGDYGSYLNTDVYGLVVPIFPADDAYVTVVGGTELSTQSAGGAWASETGWENSGGGYYSDNDPIDNTPIPSWQQLAGVINSQNQGSTTLRNSPDVAAEANNDFFVCADQMGCIANTVGGTSFAAPMWAGYIALANQQAAQNGNPPVGFINPAIYQLGLGTSYNTLFHDITSGFNDGGEGGLGFNAVPGFDLVTGWGSPDGAPLINALVSGRAGAPGISFSPASLKFAKLGVGNTSEPKTITVKNTGTGTLSLNIIPSGDFAISSNTCGALAQGQTCQVQVTFTPRKGGKRSGAITFMDNAAKSPQSAALTGEGVVLAELSPASATFVTPVQTTSKPKVFTLTNKQDVPLTNIAIALSYRDTFSISATTCTTSLAAHSSCKISVVFTPISSNTWPSTLEVTDSASPVPQTATLTGTGQ